MSVPAVRGEGEAQNAPRSRKGEQTRARLLDAAKEIFEENGFLDARITDIAERAGLSHGAFYHYFDSKEQVFREIAEMLDEYLSEVMETVIFAPGASVDPRERMETALRSHLERYRDEARIMGVIEQVARYDEHVAAVRSAVAKAGDRGRNDVRVDRAERVPLDAEAPENTGPVVVHHDVGRPDEIEERPAGFVPPEIQRNPPLTFVVRGEARPPEAVSGKRLDLDYVCAEIGEQRGRERSRDDRAEVEHAHSRQRARDRSCRRTR